MSTEKQAAERIDTECPCGGLIVWLDDGDRWDGSCYGQCGDYPVLMKPARPSDTQ